MHPLNCKEVTTLLTTVDVKELPLGQRLLVRFHMLICYVCRHYERQIQHIASAFRAVIKKSDDPAQVERLKTQLIHDLTKH